jgi:HD-GYP domain-containing protein (c-di-GMP phosphodiesterase class II)
LFSRILSICQTLDVFATAADPATAFQVLEERSGRWFDPQLVRAMRPLQFDREIWENMEPDRARALAMRLEPASDTLMADDVCLTKVCEGFAGVIDAKSPWTHQHSQGVARAAVGIAHSLSLPASDILNIERAALLHDIGKLSLSNAILDKPSKLSEQEFAEVRRHPYFTQRILEKISTFEDITFIASAHHERLDGSGYFRNLSGDALTLSARILAIADVYDALSAERPYRDALAPEVVLQIIARDVPHALCPIAFDGLKMWMDRSVRVAA